VTRTGRLRESTVVPFSVTIGGRDLGGHDLLVTYAPNREAGQNNYTSLLHLGSLADEFTRRDLEGRLLLISRDATGQFALLIS